MSKVTVVGGGLGGLIAAIECAERGGAVELLEPRGRLRGRASFMSGPLVAGLGPHALCTGGSHGSPRRNIQPHRPGRSRVRRVVHRRRPQPRPGGNDAHPGSHRPPPRGIARRRCHPTQGASRRRMAHVARSWCGDAGPASENGAVPSTDRAGPGATVTRSHAATGVWLVGDRVAAPVNLSEVAASSAQTAIREATPSWPSVTERHAAGDLGPRAGAIECAAPGRFEHAPLGPVVENRPEVIASNHRPSRRSWRWKRMPARVMATAIEQRTRRVQR